MINVTKTFLPPYEAYTAILERAWSQNWITNRGVLVNELETELKKYLGVSHLLAMTNGTLPLQIAIKVLDLKGEVITTPFSYVATVSSIVWEHCKPVFVDIDPKFLTIDETQIEAAITPQTSAILATHVFGNPCNLEVIDNISKRYGLKVIYDAAHCFGVTYKGRSVFNYGDISTTSFHATKLFHTGEGGAIFANNEAIEEQIFFHHNFGHKGKEAFQGLGINAKMSELQAAMGLAILPHMEDILERRKTIVETYNKGFKNTNLGLINIREETEWNYSYYPVIFENEAQLYSILETLKNDKIYARRYFYPSLNKLPYLNDQECPVSEDIANRILCLPLYHDLSEGDVQKIVSLIKSAL